MQQPTGTKNKNLKAGAWTITVHVLLFILFFLVKYTAPAKSEPPLPEMGMEVNLGSSDNGSGTDQPMAIDDPAPDNAAAHYKATASENNASKDILKTDEADAPAIKTATTDKTDLNNKDEQKAQRVKASQQVAANTKNQVQKPRYIYNGGTGRGGNGAQLNKPGSSEGNTTGNGDRGVPNGTPGAANYSGIPGSGNGISHNISGRSIIAFPPPDADFREGGKVVIRVTVNRQGAIVNKQIVLSSNAQLSSIALHKVDKIKFNKSDDAPEEQFGNITFVFKTRS